MVRQEDCKEVFGNRVLVIGCCGAGKTTFARQLSQATGIPLIHLDQQYWQPGWGEPDKEQWTATVESLISEPFWIMDGNYLNTLRLRISRADTIIFLDLPRRLCLWRALLRILRNLGRTRSDMAQDCPERFDWKFLSYIWNYKRVQRPRVIEALGGFAGNMILHKSATDVATYLDAICARKC